MDRHDAPGTAGAVALVYRGTTIRQQGAMLNLTDMWKAAGSLDNQRPSDWLALDETARFRSYAKAHWTEFEEPSPQNAGQNGIFAPDDDIVSAERGRQGGTWAHWQLALSYARYLSPRFHLWCNAVLRSVMARGATKAGMPYDPVIGYLERQFRRLHERLDTVDRHAADLMFLQLAAQDLLLGRRRDFSERSQAVIVRVAAAEPFDGQCPCCSSERVLNDSSRPALNAAFDHFFHRGLNRPEHGWLICGSCHAELTHGGYLARFARMPEFRAFQAAVLEERRRARPNPGRPAK